MLASVGTWMIERDQKRYELCIVVQPPLVDVGGAVGNIDVDRT